MNSLRRKQGFLQALRFRSSFRENFNDAKKALRTRIELDIAQAGIEIKELERMLAAPGLTAAQQNQLLGQIDQKWEDLRTYRLQRNQVASLPARDLRMTAANLVNMRRYMETFMKGDYFAALIGGVGFFDRPDAPGQMFDKFGFSYTDRGGNVVTKKGFAIVIPKSDINPVYARLAGAYYFTPGSLVKSFFWNGEMFAFNVWRKQQNLIKSLNNPAFVNALRTSGLPQNLWQGFVTGNSLNVSAVQANYEGFLTFLSGAGLGNASQRAASALGSHRLSGRFYHFFSSGQRAWTNSRLFKILFDKKKGLNARFLRAISNRLLKLSSSRVWQRAVLAFSKGGLGIRQLVGVGVRTLLSSLGVSVGGPLGAAVVYVLSELAMKVGYAVAKPLVRLLLISLIGLLFLLPAMGTVFGIFGTDSLTSAYRHVPPGEALQCVDNNPHAGLYPEPPIENTGSGIPPSDSLCPLDYSPLICNQGTHGNVSSYHLQTRAIDVRTRVASPEATAWHAPSDGHIVSYDPDKSCADGKSYGGTLVFQDEVGNIYKMLHIRALKSSGDVDKGEAIAVVRTDLEPSDCWTGQHHHLEVLSSGGYQDAYDWYVNKLQCAISVCPP
jgi:hypothetical protein